MPDRFARRTKAGWSAERRARQAELIRRRAPWRHSTGPKTEAGKARCAKNALRHGGRSRARIHELRRIRYVLRLAAENIRKLRLYIQLRRNAGRPRIKYKPRPMGVANLKELARLVGRSSKSEGGSLGANRALVRCFAKQKSGGEPCVHWLL